MLYNHHLNKIQVLLYHIRGRMIIVELLLLLLLSILILLLLLLYPDKKNKHFL